MKEGNAHRRHGGARARVLCQGAEGVQEVCAEAGTLLGTRHHQRLGFRLAALLDQVADRLDRRARQIKQCLAALAGGLGHLLEAGAQQQRRVAWDGDGGLHLREVDAFHRQVQGGVHLAGVRGSTGVLGIVQAHAQDADRVVEVPCLQRLPGAAEMGHGGRDRLGGPVGIPPAGAGERVPGAVAGNPPLPPHIRQPAIRRDVQVLSEGAVPVPVHVWQPAVGPDEEIRFRREEVSIRGGQGFQRRLRDAVVCWVGERVHSLAGQPGCRHPPVDSFHALPPWWLRPLPWPAARTASGEAGRTHGEPQSACG